MGRAVIAAGLFLLTWQSSAMADAPKADRQQDKILVVVAHPDDETMAAKALKTASQKGAAIEYLYLTEGEGGIKVETKKVLGIRVAKHTSQGLVKTPMTNDPRALAAIRVHELEGYHRKFGETSDQRTMLEGNHDAVRSNGSPDWNLAETRAIISKKIDAYEPTYVVTLSESEQTHPGHQAASTLTQQAIESVREARRASGDARPTPAVFRILEDGWYVPTSFDSMTHGQEARVVEVPLSRSARLWKRAAVRSFATQPCGHMTECNRDLKSSPKSERFVAAASTNPERVAEFRALVGTSASMLERAKHAGRVVGTLLRPANPDGMHREPTTASRTAPPRATRVETTMTGRSPGTKH